MKTLILASCLVLLAAGTVRAQCDPPRYKKFRDTAKTLDGSMTLSVRPADLTLEKLVCLTQTLRRQHNLWRRWSAFIFTSDDAAREFVPPNGAGLAEDRLRELRARLDIGENNLSLTITPIGYAAPYFVATPLGSIGQTVYNTRIDLALKGVVQCRLQINSRCLFSLAPPAYPKEALAARASGKVVVTGTTDRDGKVAASVEPAGRGDAHDSLVRASLDNLGGWRLEPMRRQDTFRVTYSYVIDPSLRAGLVDVKFELPAQITIRANP